MTPNKPFKIHNQRKEAPDNRPQVPLGTKVCTMCKTIHNISPLRILNRWYCMDCFKIAKKIKELNVPRKHGRNTLHIPRYEDDYFTDDPVPVPEPILPEGLDERYAEIIRHAREQVARQQVVPNHQYTATKATFAQYTTTANIDLREYVPVRTAKVKKANPQVRIIDDEFGM